MATVIPQTDAQDKTLAHITLPSRLVAATTTGLVKEVNEDCFGYTSVGGVVRACMADGHWGSTAARKAVRHWLALPSFPQNKDEAATAATALQTQLYDAYGTPDMDAARDFTPETSFICIEIQDQKLTLVSYGDCRLMTVRKGVPDFVAETRPTWLGAFSHLGLRGRQSAAEGTVFCRRELAADELVCMFSDGVDECVYEQPTISTSRLAHIIGASDPAAALKTIFAEVFSHGAEDNATLALIR